MSADDDLPRLKAEDLVAWGVPAATAADIAEQLSHLAECREAGALLVERVRELRTDAERWRRLVGCERVRIMGHAHLGQRDAHMGVEFWGEHPGPDYDGAEVLTAFVDGLKPTGKR